MITLLVPDKVDEDFIKFREQLVAEVTKAIGVPEHMLRSRPLTSAEEFYYLQRNKYCGKTTKLFQALS